MTNTTNTPCRVMPTENDLDEITAISRAYSGHDNVHTPITTSGGVLVRYNVLRVNGQFTPCPAPALEAVGYTVTRLREGLVLVTGALDALAVVEGQIAALQRRRAELVADRRSEQDRFEEQMGGPF